MRGLCGTFTGEPLTDYTTPQNCIVRDPSKFVASYALLDETCQSESVKSKKQEASQSPCYTQNVRFANVISGQYSSDRSESQSSYNKHSNGPEKMVRGAKIVSCSKISFRTKDVQDKICISAYALTECLSPKCKATQYISKKVSMQCLCYISSISSSCITCD